MVSSYCRNCDFFFSSIETTTGRDLEASVSLTNKMDVIVLVLFDLNSSVEPVECFYSAQVICHTGRAVTIFPLSSSTLVLFHVSLTKLLV